MNAERMSRELGSITFTVSLLEAGCLSIDVDTDLSASLQLSHDDMPAAEKANALAATRDAGLQVALFFTHLLAAEKKRYQRFRAEDAHDPGCGGTSR